MDYQFDLNIANEMLLEMYAGVSPIYFAVETNEIRWLLEKGYVDITINIGIARITDAGIKYLDKITDPRDRCGWCGAFIDKGKTCRDNTGYPCSQEMQRLHEQYMMERIRSDEL